jgi:Hemerythrin HHE cation binding domain
VTAAEQEQEQEQDVVDLLLSQHNEIKALMAEVRAERGERKQQAFQRLVRLLAVHESAEEQVVHPIARRNLDDAVDARLREEDDAKTLLAELHDMGVADSAFDTRFAALEAAVLVHAEQEEREEFPALRRHVDPAMLRRLAGAVRAAEAAAPSRPHPEAGTHAVTNLFAGPPVALFDKVREAVGRWRESHGNH